MKLVLGIGNPGGSYEGTRHNVGYRVLDALASREGGRWRRDERLRSEVCDLERARLIKPLTYVNRSGEAAAAALESGPADRILVVCDDVYLQAGRLRLRPSGSDGGHNGLKSLIEKLGTKDFARLRVGVGAPESGTDLAEHVLGPFRPEEEAAIAQALGIATEVCGAWIERGFLPARELLSRLLSNPKKEQDE
ncbi:MAG: Peptidyl-tRNA hydrolase [Candidatus Omnitrophica bacterium]|nr:Peptidyl-tRNA hydrolase [Candidatus Omnitrophota bacterium]